MGGPGAQESGRHPVMPTCSHTLVSRKRWIWMQATRAPVVLEEEAFLGLQGGVQAGAGIVRTPLLSGHLTAQRGQDDSSNGQVGAARFFQPGPSRRISLPPPAPPWPLTGSAEQRPGVERHLGHTAGAWGLGGRGWRAGCPGSAPSPVGLPLSCLRLPFLTSHLWHTTIPSRAFHSGWGLRGLSGTGQAEPTPLFFPRGSEVPAPPSGLWKGPRG